MPCPLCGHRKARRQCPALGQSICSVCCGKKRLVEIACTSSCVHLAAAREHPAAATRRQQERDVALLLPSIRHLTERQHQLFFLFQTVIVRHTPEGLARLVDSDVADAAAAVASTLETAARGVIYEHSAQSRPAQRLASEFKGILEEMREHGAAVYDREAALVLRAIEQGAREVGAGAAPTDYLELVARLLHVNRAAAGQAVPEPSRHSSIVLP